MNYIVYCLILSILQSVLFFEKQFGISVIIFASIALIFMVKILYQKEKVKNKKAFILIVPIVLLSSTYAIWNNQFFAVFNILAVMGLFAFMVYLVTNEENIINFKNIVSNVFLIIFKPIIFLNKPINEISNIFSRYTKDKERTRTITRVILGIILAIPVVFVVVGLLNSADIVFSDITGKFGLQLTNVFNQSFIFRIILIVLAFLYFGGYLYNIFEKNVKTKETFEIIERKSILDNVTIQTVTTILNVIYLLFCSIQFSYLFMKIGGTNFDYAEYARSGFFQLMAVTFINFIVIIVSNVNKSVCSNRAIIYKKVMNILLCIFTFIILISAFYRMRLYELEYGYTTLRLFVYIILGTEAVLTIPTVMYILNTRIPLLKYCLVIIITVYTAINFINMDEVIAKRNVDRYFETGKIDIEYLVNNLSIDAAPQIHRLLESNDYEIKSRVYEYFKDIKHYTQTASPFEFNFYKYKVKNLM